MPRGMRRSWPCSRRAGRYDGKSLTRYFPSYITPMIIELKLICPHGKPYPMNGPYIMPCRCADNKEPDFTCNVCGHCRSAHVDSTGRCPKQIAKGVFQGWAENTFSFKTEDLDRWCDVCNHKLGNHKGNTLNCPTEIVNGVTQGWAYTTFKVKADDTIVVPTADLHDKCSICGQRRGEHASDTKRCPQKNDMGVFVGYSEHTFELELGAIKCAHCGHAYKLHRAITLKCPRTFTLEGEVLSWHQDMQFEKPDQHTSNAEPAAPPSRDEAAELRTKVVGLESQLFQVKSDRDVLKYDCDSLRKQLDAMEELVKVVRYSRDELEKWYNDVKAKRVKAEKERNALSLALGNANREMETATCVGAKYIGQRAKGLIMADLVRLCAERDES